MYKTLLLVSALVYVTPAFSSEKPESKKTDPAAVSRSSHSICDNITQSLSHLKDEKAKSVITAFCALSSHGNASYVDKLQVTINIQGNDTVHTEKHKHKENYGTKNKYINDYDDDYYDLNCPYCVSGTPHPFPGTLDNSDTEKPSPLPITPDSKDKNVDAPEDISQGLHKEVNEEINMDDNQKDVESKETAQPSLLDMIKNPKLRQKVGFALKKQPILSKEEQIKKAEGIIEAKRQNIEEIKKEIERIKTEETKIIKGGSSTMTRKAIRLDLEKKRKDWELAIKSIKHQEEVLNKLQEGL